MATELDTSVHGLTELRVHGVSGTPPEDMLAQPAPMVKRVAGDDKAGFWRRWYPGGSSHDEPDEHHLEAYSWGGLTSGSATRALWVLLIPFTLVNLAHWMLPPGRRGSRAASTSVALLRLIGLSFTLTVMLATALATMDVAAWQCGAMRPCAEKFGPLAFVADWQPGPRLAFGALLPALLVIVLWRLGRAELRPLGDARPPAPAVPTGDVPLSSDSFWAGDRSTVRMRAVHVTAWAGLLGALTLVPPLRYGQGGGARLLAGELLALDVLLVVLAVAATCVNAITGRGGTAADQLTRPLVLIRWLAVAALGLSLVATAALPARYPPAPAHLPGLRATVLGLFLAQLVLLAALFVCVGLQAPWRIGREHLGFHVAIRGFAAPVTVLLGWLVGGAFSAGGGLWLAEYLGTPVTSTGTARASLDRFATLLRSTSPNTFAARVDAVHADRPLIVPPAFFWAGTAALVSFVLTLLLVVVVVLRVRGARRRLVGVVQEAYPGQDAPARALDVARVRAMADLGDHVGNALFVVSATATAVVVVGMATYLWGGYDYVEKAWLARVTALGTGAIALAAAALVSLAFWGFRDRSVRRYVGILWDIATFWPRANHPLTPPCYGERAVPDLADRVAELTTVQRDRTVLSGHSQGSILVTATVLQLDAQTLSRTALLTYGCPLRRLYARFFPAYFGLGSLTAAQAAVGGRWTNLWAPSDPIGAWVLTGGAQAPFAPPDEPLTDPASLMPGPEGMLPPLCGHSGYLLRAEYTAAVQALATAP